MPIVKNPDFGPCEQCGEPLTAENVVAAEYEQESTVQNRVRCPSCGAGFRYIVKMDKCPECGEKLPSQKADQKPIEKPAGPDTFPSGAPDPIPADLRAEIEVEDDMLAEADQKSVEEATQAVLQKHGVKK